MNLARLNTLFMICISQLRFNFFEIQQKNHTCDLQSCNWLDMIEFF